MSMYRKFFELTMCFLLQSLQAVQSWEEEIVCFLLEHHANPHIKDCSGNTALHYAVYGGKPSMAEKLLQYGANIEERTKVRIILLRNICDVCRTSHHVYKLMHSLNENAQTFVMEIILSVGTLEVRLSAVHLGQRYVDEFIKGKICILFNNLLNIFWSK